MAERESRPVSRGEASAKKSVKDLQVPNWIVIVILLAMVSTGVLFFLFNNSGKTRATAATGTTFSSAAAEDAAIVEVLPQTMRGFDAASARSPFGEEKLGAIKITGIISNSQGKSTAILELDGMSFIVNEGEQLPRSQWMVDHISDYSVTFTFESSEKTVFMDNFNTLGGESSAEEDFTKEADEVVIQDPDSESSSSSSGSENSTNGAEGSK